MTVIVATLPALGFSPFYLRNHNYIQKYNSVINKLSKELNFSICSMDNLEEHLIDGVHFTHEGYNEIAERWSKKILEIGK